MLAAVDVANTLAGAIVALLSPVMSLGILYVIRKVNVQNQDVQKAVADAEASIINKIVGELENGVQTKLDRIDRAVGGHEVDTYPEHVNPMEYPETQQYPEQDKPGDTRRSLVTDKPGFVRQEDRED